MLFAFTKPAPPVLRKKVVRRLNTIGNDAFIAAVRQFDTSALPVAARYLTCARCTLMSYEAYLMISRRRLLLQSPTELHHPGLIVNAVRAVCVCGHYRTELSLVSLISRQAISHPNYILLRDTASPTYTASLTDQALSTFFVEKVAKVRAATQLCQPATYTGLFPSHFDNFSLYTVDDIRRFLLESPKI